MPLSATGPSPTLRSSTLRPLGSVVAPPALEAATGACAVVSLELPALELPPPAPPLVAQPHRPTSNASTGIPSLPFMFSTPSRNMGIADLIGAGEARTDRVSLQARGAHLGQRRAVQRIVAAGERHGVRRQGLGFREAEPAMQQGHRQIVPCVGIRPQAGQRAAVEFLG